MAVESVSRALSQAGVRLLNSLIERAQDLGDQTDQTVYIIVEHWAREVVNAADLPAVFDSAQTEFAALAAAHIRWLEALGLLMEFGGDHAPQFAEHLWRAYFFRLEESNASLWKLYPDLARQVSMRVERDLAPSWREWVLQVQTLMSIAEAHLLQSVPTFEQLIVHEDVADLLENLTLEAGQVPALPEQQITFIVGPQFDSTATLVSYLNICIEKIGQLDPRGLPHIGGSPVPLADVYTPLRLVPLDDNHAPARYVRYQTAGYLSPEMSHFHEPLSPHDLDAHPGLSPGEVLPDHPLILLVGESGAGKTTFLRSLVHDNARSLLEGANLQTERQSDGTERIVLARPLPIFVDLARFIDERLPDESLEAFALRAAADLVRDGAVVPVLESFLKTGQCLLLLDGLDQAAGDEQRRLLTEQVSAASLHWQAVGNQVIVTARLGGYDLAPLPPQFEGYVVRPLDRGQIGPFVLRWALALIRLRRPLIREEEALQQAQSETLALVRELTTTPAMSALAANPLTLRMLLGLYYPGMIFAPQRVAVYQVVADALIHEWHLPTMPGGRPAIMEQEATTLLGQLAFWLHASRPAGVVNEDELRALLAHIWRQNHPDAPPAHGDQAVEDFIGHLRSGSGPLVELASGRFGFVYSALQEYFAARYTVASYRLAAGRIRAYLHEPRWDEVIRLAIGFTALRSPEDASDLIEVAVLAAGADAGPSDDGPSPFEDYLRRDLFFAARLLGGGLEARPELAGAIVSALAALWLDGDRDSPGRFSLIFDVARRCLVNLDGSAAGRRVLALMLDNLAASDQHRQAYAADAVTFWPSYLSEVREALTRAGRTDPPPLTRRAIARALGRLEKLPEESYRLLLTLVADPEEEVSKSARESLRALPPAPAEAFGVFMDLLRGSLPAGRRVSLRQLQQIGTLPASVVNELMHLLNDPEEEIRTGAMNVLAATTNLPDNALMSICRIAMDSMSPLRPGAVAALRRPVELPPEVIGFLVEWSEDPDVNIRRAASQALGACKNTSSNVMEALIERLDDPVDSVRAEVIEPLAIKGAEHPRAVHVLTHAVADPSHRVRMALASALGRFSRPDADVRRALRLLVDDRQIIVRETAIHTIGALADPGAELVEYLVELVSEAEFGIGGKAVGALARLRHLPESALRVLVRSLPAHWQEHGPAISACLRAHSPLGAELVNEIMDLAVLRPVRPSHEARTPAGLRALALEILGHAVREAPDIVRVLLDAAIETTDPEGQIAALRGLANSRTIFTDMKIALFGLIKQERLNVRCSAAITLATLVHTVPDPPVNTIEMRALADLLAGLIREVTPRPAWEENTALQNELLVALSRVVARARPTPPRLSARLEDAYREADE